MKMLKALNCVLLSGGFYMNFVQRPDYLSKRLSASLFLFCMSANFKTSNYCSSVKQNNNSSTLSGLEED